MYITELTQIMFDARVSIFNYENYNWNSNSYFVKWLNDPSV